MVVQPQDHRRKDSRKSHKHNNLIRVDSIQTARDEDPNKISYVERYDSKKRRRKSAFTESYRQEDIDKKH